MALRHRLADAGYWFYDRLRHRSAFDAAEQPCTATDFSGCEGKKYALLARILEPSPSASGRRRRSTATTAARAASTRA